MPQSNLEYVKTEAADIESLLRSVAGRIESKSELETLLRRGEIDVLHFACHGRYNADSPGRSEVRIGEQIFRPWDVVAENRTFLRTQPVVFVNACDSGRAGMGLTGIDGWARAFLKAGPGELQPSRRPSPSRSYAGAFIGSTWKTTDELASRFSVEFYRGLLAGSTIGEAMRGARARVKQAGDATYLSYTLYANPNARAVRPVATPNQQPRL